MAKAPIYQDGTKTNQQLLSRLRESISAINDDAPEELRRELWEAFSAVEASLVANVPITRGGSRVGSGVSKERKAIACDAIISIARQIKASKAW